MQRLNVLLLDRLLRHERNMWLARRRADRLGVIAIVLLTTHERLHILWADDLHLVAERFKLAGPEKRRRCRPRPPLCIGRPAQQLRAVDRALPGAAEPPVRCGQRREAGTRSWQYRCRESRWSYLLS